MTVTFLPKDPTLNKKEQDTSFSFANEPYNKLYTEGLGSQLFEGVKVKRKETSMPKLKFKPLKIDSYNQLAINKYNPDSPLAGATTSGVGSVDTSAIDDLEMPAPTFKQVVERKKEQIANFPTTLKSVATTVGSDLKTGAGDFASTAIGLLDIPLQQYAKAGAGVTTVAGGTYYFAQEFADSIPSFEDVVAFGSNPFRDEQVDIVPRPDFMKAAVKTEELKELSEWFFGTKLEFGDYLDVRSSHEKRTEMFNQMPIEMQEQLSKLDNWTLAFDVTAGIASGIASTKAPLALANKIGITTTLGKNMVSLDLALTKVVGQIPKLGVAYGAAALGYYQQTGKWLFEGDVGATEGSAMFIASAGLRGLGKLGAKGWEMSSGGRQYVKDMLADPDFQKGVRTYFEEAKNAFADDIDKFAVKSGVRTNLLPDSKIINEAEEITNARNGIDDEFIKKGQEGFDLLKNASDTSARSKKGFYNKALSEGIIDEGDSMYKAISRKAKLAFSPEKKVDEVAGMMLGDTGIKFKKNFKFKDAIMGNFFDPANREIRDSLEGTRVFGKIQNFNNVLDEARSSVQNISEFNAYLFAKSRYFKTKGKNLPTNVLIEKGGKKEVVDISSDQLKATYLVGEKKYGKIADRIHKQYQSLLQYEKSLGIRNDEDLLNFAKNPYWMPDKELDISKAFKEGISNLSIKTPKAFLSKTQGTVDNNTLLNTYADMSYRYEVANRIDKLMKAKNSGIGLVKELKEGAKPEKGFVEFKLYENGEQVSFQGKDFFVKSVLQDDKLSTNILMRAASVPTRLLKSSTTGILDPVYQITAPYFEMSAALVKNWVNGGKASDFLTTAFAGSKSKVSDKFIKLLGKIPGVDMTNVIENAKGGDFFATPAMKKNFIEMANFLGGTFTKGSRARMELEATLGDEFTRYSAKKTAFEKGKDATMKVRDALDIGNSIELFTTRLPMFASELKRQGLSPSKFKEMVEGVSSPTQLIKKLEDAGFSPQKAANLSRNLYDYNIAKKTVDESGRVLAYLSDVVARGPASVKRLMEDNPNAFIKGMGVGMTAGAAIYAFNTNSPEKKAAYENTPDYIKNSPYLFIYDEETGEGEALRISKNMPMLDWTYSMYVQMVEGSEEGFDFTKAFSNILEDTTGLFSLEKKFGLNTEILPNSINRYVKYKTGFDLKNNYQSFKRTDLEKTMPSEDYDKTTSNFAIGLSRMIAILNGGEMTEVAGRKVVSGDTYSPRLIDSLLDNVDSGFIRGQGQKLMTDFKNEGRIDRWEVNEFVKVFLKKVSVTDFDEEEYARSQDAKGQEQLINSIIKTQVKNAPDNRTSIDRALELVTKYPRKETVILNAIKDRSKIDNFKDANGDMNLFYMAKGSNAVIARMLISKIEDGLSKKEAIGQILTMAEQGLISETKGKNILKKLIEISSE